MTTSDEVVAGFERWGPAAFIVGGIGILGTTVVASLNIAGVMPSTPRLAMGPLLFGLWFVFGGLIGLYPRVAHQSPRLSTGGLWTSGGAWVAWTGTLSAAVLVDLTSERTLADPGSWGPPLLAGAFVLAVLSFLAYGIASARSATPSRTVGFLLLIPVAALLGQAVLLVSKIVTGEVVAVLQLGFGAVTAIVLFAVGYLLRGDTGEAPHAESRVEPTG